jgi:DNA polymerase III epsilon subunit
MVREIILDTETTGLDPAKGDRIVEIGAVELLNHLPTGRTFHVYINPERDMPKEAEAVHGLSSTFLKDKPVFASIAQDFLEFLAEDVLIIHNASFDMAFINAELGFLRMRQFRRSGWSTRFISPDRSTLEPPTASMRCAAAMASTTADAQNTGHFLIQSFWRRSI